MWITTILDPLSAGLKTMSVHFFNDESAHHSDRERLSQDRYKFPVY